MTTSGACLAGACSACRCTNTTCDHDCHVDGAGRITEPVRVPVIENLDVGCPHPRCEHDLQRVDGLVICVGCGDVPEECDCDGCECCDDDGNHVHDEATCMHPCCPEAGAA